jgi:hypothetical protein
MLEERFEKLVSFGNSENKLTILNTSIMEMMRHEGFGDMLTEQVASLIQCKWKALTQRKFALLLLKILTSNTKKQLKFCFDLFDFSRNSFLDCATLCTWYQSDAEPLIRNDLLSICKLLKTYDFNNRKQSDVRDYKEKRVLKVNWDLGLWGHVCKKVSNSFRDHLRIVVIDKQVQIDIKNEVSGSKGDKEGIGSEEFKDVEFVNGIPDVLFLVIQIIYGMEVCDAYCNYLGVKLFRPYNKDNRLILNRIYPLSQDLLQKFKYSSLLFK